MEMLHLIPLQLPLTGTEWHYLNYCQCFHHYLWMNPSAQKLTYLWTQLLHHVTEKVIKLFALNVAIICSNKKSEPFSLYNLVKPED